MAILRFSVFTPQSGNEERVANLLEALDIALSQQKGYVLGLRFRGRDGSSELGRIFVWESWEVGEGAEASAEATPLIRRIQELCQSSPLALSYDLQGYALRPS